MIQVSVKKNPAFLSGAILLLKTKHFRFLRRIIISDLICSFKRAAPPQTHTHFMRHIIIHVYIIYFWSLAPNPLHLSIFQTLVLIMLSCSPRFCYLFLINNPSINCTSLLLASATPSPLEGGGGLNFYIKKSPTRTSYHWLTPSLYVFLLHKSRSGINCFCQNWYEYSMLREIWKTVKLQNQFRIVS